MQIRRLKLSGFKSFVEPAELRIEPGLTGVVGPNGCGKSNLLEAIRWVMGEGSAKSLRGGGMEDVIFAGTATRPTRDFAEVSLLIEEADGDREVTRRIERGAGSAYRLDGRDVRAKDVALLFADAATGAHSPALVSQGRIGAVIAAKPVERRLMLEEAAGISGLHVRRKDAEQKLRATETNLARLDEILSDQEQRIAQLRRQARAAERYRAMSDRIRLAEGRLIYARWAEADRAARTADEEAKAAAGEVAALQDAMSRAQVAQEHAARLVAGRRAATQEARDAGRSLAHQLATARSRRDTVVRRLAELERLSGSLAAETARELALQEDAVDAIAKLKVEREAIEARLADGEASAARVTQELGALEAVSREAEATLAGLLAKDAALRAERRVAEAALDAAKAQLARAETEAQRIDGQIAALGDGVELLAAVASARVQGAEARAAAEGAERALAKAERARAETIEQRDQQEIALAAKRAALAAAEAERATLIQALDRKADDTALAAVSADPGYERALAAALGDDLDAPVTGEGARRWSGTEAASDDPPLAAGLSPLLDHVGAPHALHRRLAQIGVADRDDGQQLAVGQRVVTLNGAMRRWDGFLSVGTGAAAAERLVRINRLAALEKELPGAKAAVARALAERDSASDAVDVQRKTAETARTDFANAEKSAREAMRAGDAAAVAIERIEGQRTALTERRNDLAPLLAAATDAARVAAEAIAALPAMAVLAEKIEAGRSTAKAAGEAVADKRAEAATRVRETSASRERLATAAREAGEWRRRGSVAEERLVETAERAKALIQEQAELASQPQSLATEVAGLEVQAASSEALVGAAAASEREADEALADVTKALAGAGEVFGDARERRAGAVARVEGHELRRREYAGICGEKFECPPPLLPGKLGFAAQALAAVDEESRGLDRLIAERERLGPVNLVADQELSEAEASRASGAAERDELQEAIHRLRGSIGSLNREGRVRLLDAYEKVDGHFRSLFTTLFEGGQARLELVENDDPLEAGLEIMAQPPGKRLTALTLLSGGEQALTAVALIFALFLTNPAPICVLDEVDAPLDDANVDRFCNLLDRMTGETDTRFLIVTHNAVTMSRMHRLYGVTMIEKGVSRLVSVDLGGAEQLLAAE
ncbi:MAG: chromosome segregation protein SMC [Sphingomicrobium sp.]|nr:chromosome segregation protein SMC [Sphingomonadales bacterium]